MPVIDNRLRDCNGEPEFTENFNRVLGLLDAALSRVGTLESDTAALKVLAICTVTFDSDGGTEVAAQEVAFDGVAAEPTAPTKEGYTLGGWYLDDEVYAFESPVRTNITLTAHWTEV